MSEGAGDEAGCDTCGGGYWSLRLLSPGKGTREWVGHDIMCPEREDGED